MKIKIIPEKSFSFKEEEGIKRIMQIAIKNLQENSIPVPNSLEFYNSYDSFIERVLPEVMNYGFDKEVSKEIIKCALNNGTYGTIDFKKDSIIEMNFNPFNKGEYSPLEFLELIIHESLHLFLSRKVNKDINKLKFKFKGLDYCSNPKIIQFDEGFAEFVTNKIIKGIDLEKIKKIKIPIKNKLPPKYKKEVRELKIEQFDKEFEELLLNNRKVGEEIFRKKFSGKEDINKIVSFAVENLRKIL